VGGGAAERVRGRVGGLLGHAHGLVTVGVDLTVGVRDVRGSEEIQRLLGVGEEPDRVSPSYAEVAVVTQRLHRGGHRRHRVVERDRIGGVETHEHLADPRRSLLVADLDAAGGEGLVVVGDRAVRVGVQPGLVDQHPHAVRVQAPRLPHQQAVRVPGRDEVEVPRHPGRLPPQPHRNGQ
jgi:hypothetical protein